MLKTPDVLLLLCLAGSVNPLYKQWIPDTNYENKTNWDKNAVPCGNDIIKFPAQREVSVFVADTHAVQEMWLPIDGEFILNSGAGFYAVTGQDPGCGAGVMTEFKDSESLQWFDPALWQAASSLQDLQSGNFLFSVHVESVPCRYDDVVFKALSSFRVDTSSSHSSVPVKSVSVQGKVFESKPDFSQYLGSSSGRLQFHGSSAVSVGEPSCGDPTGCDCGNSVNQQRICSTVTCSPLSCKKPLLPQGHCCVVCGAIVTIDYAAGFNLQTYRDRIHHLFLVLPKYESIQLGMSKVFKSRRLFGIIPFAASPEIQVVILDGEDGRQAETLAWDIIRDVRSHGSNLGIIEAEFEASSGNTSDPPGNSVGVIVGAVFGILIIIALTIVVVFFVRKGFVQMPPLPSLRSFKRSSDSGSFGPGYDNPIFDTPDMPDIVGQYATKDINTINLTQTGVYFINPSYDENETDFNA